MNSDLELLLKLQVIDYDIGELERSKEYIPDMMDNLNREIREAVEAADNAAKELEESKVRQASLELTLNSKEADLQKHQQQMMQIKTNKEYDALVAEIDAIKETISQTETVLLETIERISVLEKDIGALKEKAGQVRENNERQLAVLQEKIDSIGDVMSDKESGRREIMSAVNRATLSVYERIKRGRGGQAVVPVKRRACSSCFKALTPKKVQEVKRDDRVNTCDNCGSIIYWDEPISD